MSFRLEFSSDSIKFLKKLDKQTAKRIIEKLKKLTSSPLPKAVKFINRKNGEAIYRYRIGDYRALYSVKYKEEIILISRIDRRSKIYK